MHGNGAPTGQSWRTERGIASVELALVLPLLAVLFGVIIDLGRLLADYHAVSKSVRSATRYLTRVDAGPGALAIDCAAQTLDADAPQVRDAMRLAMTGRIDGDPRGQPLVRGWTAITLTEAATGIRVRVECVDNTVAGLGGIYRGAAAVPTVIVSATVPFTFGLARIAGLGPTTRFTIERRMAHIGR